jgi:hypothetical protein
MSYFSLQGVLSRVFLIIDNKKGKENLIACKTLAIAILRKYKLHASFVESAIPLTISLVLFT